MTLKSFPSGWQKLHTRGEIVRRRVHRRMSGISGRASGQIRRPVVDHVPRDDQRRGRGREEQRSLRSRGARTARWTGTCGFQSTPDFKDRKSILKFTKMQWESKYH